MKHQHTSSWRKRWYHIIFEADTRAGKVFDLVLLISILASLAVLMLESVPALRKSYGLLFRWLEWGFTILFTLEYLLRLWVTARPRHYALSFFGIIDLLAVLPTYVALAFAGSQYFLVIRSLRLLRVFRVLKLIRFLSEARILINALRASRIKIIVFLFAVLCIVLIMGTLMYLIEGPGNGFTSIPKSVYWCIVTLTTVGYGDIVPLTAFGQAIAAIIMIIGYGVIAVPTGIVTAELSRAARDESHKVLQKCPVCSNTAVRPNAQYCDQCGNPV